MGSVEISCRLPATDARPLKELAQHIQARTGSSNRPWLSRQTGPISSGVTRNLRVHKYPSTAPFPT